MKKFTVCFVVFLMSATATFAADDEHEQDRVRETGTVLKEILNIPDDIPRDLLDKAECLIILPSVKKEHLNDAFARQYFPGADVLGKKLKPGALNGMAGGPPLREIVGVVGNTRHFGTQREKPPAMYLPVSQLPNWCCLRSVVRTSVNPMSLEPAVRRLVSSMDPNLPVTQVRTMDDLFSLPLAQPRFAMILLGTFAGLALLLTVVGLYGVMAYSVSRRTREIGVRLALGAQRSAVMRMVLHDAAVLLLIGIAIGVAASVASASVLKTTLYGVDPHDPLVLTVVCISVTLTGFLAAYIPSIRAASIDPMKALRSE